MTYTEGSDVTAPYLCYIDTSCHYRKNWVTLQENKQQGNSEETQSFSSCSIVTFLSILLSAKRLS